MVEKGRIVIIPPILPQEFIQEMEGCITEGTPSIELLKLKEIWKTMERRKQTQK